MEALLIWSNKLKDSDGFPVEEKQEATIYVEEKSAARTEFYEAMRAGVNVKLVFETRQEDFESSAHEEDGKKAYARKIEYDGYTYDIIRAYKVGKSKIQMVCE